MADKIIAASLVLDSDQANTSVKSFKAELKEANEDLLKISKNFGPTSDAALAAAKRVGELKNQMEDARKLSDVFNTDGSAGIQAFGGAVRSLAGGFSALQGTLALVGVQGADVEKSLLKVQAALAISEGVNSIADASKQFKTLGAVIQSTSVYQKVLAISTSLTSKAFATMGIAVEGTSVAFKVLRTAIITTGIGALVVAIGFLIDKISTWQSATEEQIAKQKQLNDTILASNEIIYKNQLASYDRQQKLEEARAKLAGESEEKIFQIGQKYDKLRLNAKLANYVVEGRINGDSIKKNRDDITSFQTDVTLKQLAFNLKQKQDAEQAAKEKLAKSKADNEAQLKQDEENYKKRRQSQIDNEIVTAQTLADEKAVLAQEQQDAEDKRIKEQQDRLEGKQGSAAGIGDEATAQLQAQADLYAELAQGRQLNFQQQLDELQKWYDSKTSIVAGNEELQTALQEDYEKKKTALVEEENRQRLNIASNLLGQASLLFAKHTAAYKVIAVAQATIQTFQSAQGAFAGMVSSIPGPVGIALGVAAAAFAVVSGLKNIQRIVSTKVPGASGGGSAPSISASATAPLTPIAPQTQTTTLDQQSLNGIGNAATASRVYVLDSDVQNNQERNTRLNRAARLGS